MSKHSGRGAEWERTRLAVLDRDGWRCRWCGKELVGRDAQVDHLTPASKDGAHTSDNLVACCGDCNKRRAAKGAPLRVTWFNPKWFD